MIKRITDKITDAFLSSNVIICIAIFIVCAMGVFPPWVAKIKRGGGERLVDLGYAIIIKPPMEMSLYEMGQIDYSRLFLQWLCVVIFTGGAIYVDHCRCGERRGENK